VFKYNGTKRRWSQVTGGKNARYKQHNTHTLQVGRTLYDAADTKVFVNGLLNMNAGNVM
jgi:hypothetical protein